MIFSRSSFSLGCKLVVIVSSLVLVTACGRAENTTSSIPGPYANFIQDIQLFNQSHPLAIVETTDGTFAIELYQTQLPRTVEHFIKLAVGGRYDGSAVYNVIDNFAVYMGDKSGSMTEAADVQSLALETHPDIRHDSEGIVGMVHQSGMQCATSGNKEQCARDALNSAKTFFYITLSPEPGLNDSYAAFGKVVKGMQIVKNMRRGTTITKIAVIAK